MSILCKLFGHKYAIIETPESMKKMIDAYKDFLVYGEADININTEDYIVKCSRCDKEMEQ